MRYTVPTYYEQFHCIAGACRHSCCIGWEIDVDEETLALYRDLADPLGTRVRESLTTVDGTACFRLTAGERCPHLNEDGLCEIILGAGEAYLTQICDDHPRFRSYFSDRVEMGLGLACEEAARLVLSWREPVQYVTVEDDGEREELSVLEENILHIRAACLRVAQDRSRSIDNRLERLFEIAAVPLPPVSAWASFLSSLERLDPAWDSCLAKLTSDEVPPLKNGSAPSFDTELEQFLVYLLYRHLADAVSAEELSARIAFAVQSCRTIEMLISMEETPAFSSLAEYVRLWSSEIEYSTENTDACIAHLASHGAK